MHGHTNVKFQEPSNPENKMQILIDIYIFKTIFGSSKSSLVY